MVGRGWWFWLSGLVALGVACDGQVTGGPDERDGAAVGDAGTPVGRDGAIPIGIDSGRDGDASPGVDSGPGVDAGPTCTPTTCVAQGAECGSLPNGCGGTLRCGTCSGEAVCGGGGTRNRCGVPPDCGPAPAGATAAQGEALSAVNDVRMRVGVPCTTMIPEINQAAQAHADYGVTNASDPSCRSSGHDETMGCPGYTGTNFGARLSAAGYSGGRTEIVHFFGNPTGAVNGWLGTLWHRIPIVLPGSDHLGSGHAAGWDVMDFGRSQSADPNGVWFYPYDGQTSVSGRGGNESPPPPAPPSGCSTWGTFISVMFAPGASVTVDTHELTGPSGPERYEWLPPSASPFLSGSFAMVPCPLSAGSYTIRVTGTLGGSAFDRSSTFTVR